MCLLEINFEAHRIQAGESLHERDVGISEPVLFSVQMGKPKLRMVAETEPRSHSKISPESRPFPLPR